ncbi:MAG: hypothetical protein RXR06_06030 [Thermoproteus sp.]
MAGPLYLSVPGLSAFVVPANLGSVNIQATITASQKCSNYRVDVAVDGRTFWTMRYSDTLDAGCQKNITITISADQINSYVINGNVLQIKLFCNDQQSDEVDLPIIVGVSGEVTMTPPLYISAVPGATSASSVTVNVLVNGTVYAAACDNLPNYVASLSISSYAVAETKGSADIVDSAMQGGVSCAVGQASLTLYSNQSNLQLPARIDTGLIQSLAGSASLPQAFAQFGVKFIGGSGSATEVWIDTGDNGWALIRDASGKQYSFQGQLRVRLTQPIQVQILGGSPANGLSNLLTNSYSLISPNTSCVSGAGSYVFTPGGNCYANPKIETLYGYGITTGIPQTLSEVPHPANATYIGVTQAGAKYALFSGDLLSFLTSNSTTIYNAFNLIGLNIIVPAEYKGVFDGFFSSLAAGTSSNIYTIVDKFSCSSMNIYVATINQNLPSAVALVSWGKGYIASQSDLLAFVKYLLGSPVLFGSESGPVGDILVTVDSYTPSDASRAQLASQLGCQYMPQNLQLQLLATPMASMCYYLVQDGSTYYDLGYFFCPKSTGTVELMPQGSALAPVNINCNNGICVISGQYAGMYITSIWDLIVDGIVDMSTPIVQFTANLDSRFSYVLEQNGGGLAKLTFAGSTIYQSFSGFQWTYTMTLRDYDCSSFGELTSPGPYTATVSVAAKNVGTPPPCTMYRQTTYQVWNTYESGTKWLASASATFSFKAPSQDAVNAFKQSLQSSGGQVVGGNQAPPPQSQTVSCLFVGYSGNKATWSLSSLDGSVNVDVHAYAEDQSGSVLATTARNVSVPANGSVQVAVDIPPNTSTLVFEALYNGLLQCSDSRQVPGAVVPQPSPTPAPTGGVTQGAVQSSQSQGAPPWVNQLTAYLAQNNLTVLSVSQMDSYTWRIDFSAPDGSRHWALVAQNISGGGYTVSSDLLQTPVQVKTLSDCAAAIAQAVGSAAPPAAGAPVVTVSPACLSLGGGGVGQLQVLASSGLTVGVKGGIGYSSAQAASNTVPLDLVDQYGNKHRRVRDSRFSLNVKAPAINVPLYIYLEFDGYDSSGALEASASAWIILGPDRSTTDGICAALSS